MIAQVQNIHSRLEKAVDCFAGSANDRLVFVERGIQDNWDAGQFVEIRDWW
jgi:hypothetical protein